MSSMNIDGAKWSGTMNVSIIYAQLNRNPLSSAASVFLSPMMSRHILIMNMKE